MLSDYPLLPLLVRDLCYQRAGKTIIDNLNLEIQDSGVSVLMGPNGAGKSILLKLLHGLLSSDSGQINWNGRHITPAIRDMQVLIFQNPILLKRSVEDNLKFALKLRNKDTSAKHIHYLLQQVGLENREQQMARSLSRGEQQCLSMARAIALEPKVLLMDEPTANLDPSATSIIENIVLQQKTLDRKVILVTHDVTQAKRLADSVIFIHAGQAIENTEASIFFEQPQTDTSQRYLKGQLLI